MLTKYRSLMRNIGIITESILIATALIIQPLYSRIQKAESSSLEQATSTTFPIKSAPIIRKPIISDSKYGTQWDLRGTIENPQSNNLQKYLEERELEVLKQKLISEGRKYLDEEEARKAF